MDRRLFLPRELFDDDHREWWEKYDVPDETTFQTKPEIAQQMLQAAVAHRRLHILRVRCDELYGCSPDFLDGVADLDRWYFAEVPQYARVEETA